MEQKKEKASGRLPVVLMAILLAVTLIINIVCAQMFPAINAFMAANLNSRLPGANSNAIQAEMLSPEEAREASRAMAQELESEGLVLLENKDGALPLSAGSTVNLFGYATVDPLYGGTGSGTSDTTENVDFIQGLTNAGFQVNQELVEFYRKSGVKRSTQGGYVGANFTPAEVPVGSYDQTLLERARAYSDTAIIMLARIGGEGGDLPTDMYAAGYSTTDDGRSYLELTADEEGLLELVKGQGYSRVIVLINSSHAMELGFLEDGIDAALWIGGPGSTGFNAVGEALSGAVNPSGRLTDTYAYDLTTSPAYWNAGSFTYSNLKRNYVEYAEGIYVGYRYYETRFVDNATGQCDEAAYRDVVQYPFGYGLSYTGFEQTITDFQAGESEIAVRVSVTNTGTTAGKDVMQLYYTAPYTEGGIEKSHVVLAGFAKTDLLEPGASQEVTVTFAPESMASYDEKGSRSYVLEAGVYQIKLMGNAHEVLESREYSVAETVVYGEGNSRASDTAAAVNRFDDVSQGQVTQYLSRADWEGTMPRERLDGKAASADTVAAFSNQIVYSDDENAPPIAFASHGLTLEDMTGLAYDDPKWAQLLEQLSVEDMTKLISNGGWSTPAVESVGKPATNDLDGPAGLNSLVSDLSGVSFPSQVVIGATWNTELLERFGQTYGAEAAANHVVGLYAPGANIHRTPFSGRNFEYYSEDGLHSGKLAAAMVQGAASQGIYCYIKHFALNDQEANRLSISVWASEQSVRELYLKPFELAVKEGGTTAIMSSYNYLGNVWAGASRALLTEVLRDEWGFRGMVVTDSAMGNTGWMDVNLAIRAGGDMMLCLMGVTLDGSTNTAQQAMRQACHNILYTQANSAAVAVAADTSPYWVGLLGILDVAVLSAAVLMLLRRSKRTPALKPIVKVGIVAAIAVLAALVLWLLFFRAGTPATVDTSAPVETAAPSEEPLPSEEGQEGATEVDGLYLELTGTGDGWLVCHVRLMEDKSFTVSFDYNAENSGVQTDSGVWEEKSDGTLGLTGSSGKTYTAAPAGDGYAMDVVNEETAITCSLTGTPAGTQGAQAEAIEGLYLELTGTGDSWLVCHVRLMEDKSFTVSFDYNEENSGVQTDSGVWEERDDGALVLTGESGREYVAELSEEGGTKTYTMRVTNLETGIVCDITGASAGG